jgi:hypothetical protein
VAEKLPLQHGGISVETLTPLPHRKLRESCRLRQIIIIFIKTKVTLNTIAIRTEPFHAAVMYLAGT